MQELLDVDAKDFGSRLCLEDGRLTVGFLTSLLFDISFTTFRFCLCTKSLLIKDLWHGEDVCLS